jgi:uncharacterized SAM-binding protein YcdF (DUF218 family)
MDGATTETNRAWRPSATGAVVGTLAALIARDLELRALVSYWYDVHSLVPLAAVLGALLWHSPLQRPMAGAAAAMAALWMIVAFTPLSGWLATGLVRRDVVRPADAVFVLASRIQDDGELTGTAMTRLVHGLELVGQGHAPRLILSEMHRPMGPYAAPARALMEHLTVSGELLTVGPVWNTRDEAVQVARLCRERGWKRLLLVTSPVHSRRAAATFEREGLEIVSSPSVETRYDLETLYEPGDRILAFGSVMHERIGLWLYRRRGWI